MFYYSFKNIKRPLAVFAAVLAVSGLYLVEIIAPAAPYYFIFVAANLLLAAYLFFAEQPRSEDTLPVHLSLWMFLFYGDNVTLFYGAGLLFIGATVYFAFSVPFRPGLRLSYCLLAAGSFALAWLVHPVLLLTACSGYMVLSALSAHPFSGQPKWNTLVVGLLHVWAIIACASPPVVPYQENTVFTLPVSFAIYLVVLFRGRVRNGLHRCLQIQTLLFAYGAVVLYGYSLAGYRLITFGDNIFALYGTLSLTLGGAVLLAALYIRRRLAARQSQISHHLDPWFTEKYEDALSEFDDVIRWTGFDSKLAEAVPHDGIRIRHGERELYASGCFRDPAPPQGKVISGGGPVRLTVHETNIHMRFKPGQYYFFYALAEYIGIKLGHWEEIRKLGRGQSGGDSDFGKELKFRKEVTYYLHDQVLQNVIAVKNIAAALTTEQTALKELAVETLTELNDSIRLHMHELYPSTLKDLSFERNIHILIDDMRKRYGYIPTPHIRQEIAGKLDEESAYLFYRTVQELLNNTCKYAEADNLWITLYDSDREERVLGFKEDGKPISAEDKEVKIRHLGLPSLKSQAQSLGGTFVMEQNGQIKSFTLTLPRRTS